MRVVILAGGKGTRLTPYTDAVPKPLVSIGGGEKMLGIIIEQLAEQGFDHITLAVNHLADLIMDYAGDGSQWGVKIDYSREEKPLHTTGPLTLIPDLPEHFLTINGDTLSDIDYGDFLRTHTKEQRRLSVAAKKREVKIDFGVIDFDAKRQLTSFLEKPTHVMYVAIGANCFSREVIDALPRGAYYGFDQLLKDSLSSQQEVFIHEHEGFWLDVGRPEDYHYVVENYEQVKEILRKKK